MKRSIFVALVYLGIVSMPYDVQGQSVDGAEVRAAAAPSFTRIATGDAATDRGNSTGASWADYDGDGDLDLFVANIDGQGNFLYANDGHGNLERVTTGSLATDQVPSRGVCWADYDNDDDLDVFVSGPSSTLYVNDGLGSFSSADPMSTFGTTDLRGWACAWADYDLDGFVDLVITHPAGFVGNPSTSNHLLHNRGDGTMEEITNTPVTMGNAPYTVATWSDYDLDGDPDLFIGAGPATTTRGPDFLYKNMFKETGTADFIRITDGPLATRNRDGQVFNWIDYDNDGDLDVYVTNWGGNLGGLHDELYRNDAGVLVEITTGNIVTDKQVSLASTWGDFDNDGDLDAYVADGTQGGTSRFYDNNGDGTFSRLFTAPIINDQAASWGATAGDFDGDGDLDLFVSNASVGSLNFLYRNDQSTGNHWLKIKAVGTASNRSGVGAIVRAKAIIGGRPTWMMREVSTQNSFDGHNALTVHFGLGDAQEVDSLLVAWPSGTLDVYEQVASDQTMIATEGESLVGTAVDDEVLPEGSILSSSYPNPFRGETTIMFTLPTAEFARLTIFDPLGRVVATPVSEFLAPGPHEVRWAPREIASGPYVYRLRIGDVTITRVMLAIQ